MNWLVIVFFAVLAGNIYQGYKKGFLRVALSLVSWIAVVIAANAFAPQLTEMVVAQTSIDETIIQAINEKVTQAVDGINIEEQLPPTLREALLGDNASFGEMLTQDVAQAEKILPYIFGALQILCTVVLMIIMRIALVAADKVLALASNLPLIGSADRILGLAVGTVKGVLLTWILMTVITFGAMINGNSSDMVTMIYESQILTWLYENNIVLNFIMNL
uniref:CvpA family protein n=1 Tax=Agathobacter sp. TaxID=2021311 RepID=UPI004056F225